MTVLSQGYGTEPVLGAKSTAPSILQLLILARNWKIKGKKCECVGISIALFPCLVLLSTTDIYFVCVCW